MASLTEQSPRSFGRTNTQAYGKTEVQSKELQIRYSADDAEMGVSRCARRHFRGLVKIYVGAQYAELVPTSFLLQILLLF